MDRASFTKDLPLQIRLYGPKSPVTNIPANGSGTYAFEKLPHAFIAASNVNPTMHAIWEMFDRRAK